MKTNLKNYLTKLTGVIFEFLGEKIVSPNLQQKLLSTYTENAWNDRSFSNAGPMKKHFSRK
jgi:hypothetical protein